MSEAEYIKKRNKLLKEKRFTEVEELDCEYGKQKREVKNEVQGMQEKTESRG